MSFATMLRRPDRSLESAIEYRPTALLEARVRAQRTLIPEMYGRVDFDQVPERFTADLGDTSMLPGAYARRHRATLLERADDIRRMRAYTMLGDDVAHVLDQVGDGRADLLFHARAFEAPAG